MKSYIPDYPRPQLVRSSWENLNGSWNFAFDDENIGFAKGWNQGVSNDQTIRVPFSYERYIHGYGTAVLWT